MALIEENRDDDNLPIAYGVPIPMGEATATAPATYYEDEEPIVVMPPPPLDQRQPPSVIGLAPTEAAVASANDEDDNNSSHSKGNRFSSLSRFLPTTTSPPWAKKSQSPTPPPFANSLTAASSSSSPTPTPMPSGAARGKKRSSVMNSHVVSTLRYQGFTHGMVQALIASHKRAFPRHIWVVDNSSSMMERDGQKAVMTLENDSDDNSKNSRKKHGEITFESGTRWDEMKDTVEYHAQISGLLKIPTVFRMLNDNDADRPNASNGGGPIKFSVSEPRLQQQPQVDETEYLRQDLTHMRTMLTRCVPNGGCTPLAQHLRDIRKQILLMEPVLQRERAQIMVILATDGIPTSTYGEANPFAKKEFLDVMKSYRGLSASILIRISTAKEKWVQHYWKEFKLSQGVDLEQVNVRVLNTFTWEATEIAKHNKWINYGLPLHRIREMGLDHPVFDALQERKLTKQEIYEYCQLLFGYEAMQQVPNPATGDESPSRWNEFILCITELVAKEDRVWNPITKRLEPWIDMKRLRWEYQSILPQIGDITTLFTTTTTSTTATTTSTEATTTTSSLSS